MSYHRVQGYRTQPDPVTETDGTALMPVAQVAHFPNRPSVSPLQSGDRPIPRAINRG